MFVAASPMPIHVARFHLFINPLPSPRFGPRFPPMTTAYDKELRKLTHESAAELKMSDFVQEGVLVSLGGPSYETPSECRLLRMLGADSVGMSISSEVVVAKHCGMRVLGECSCI